MPQPNRSGVLLSQGIARGNCRGNCRGRIVGEIAAAGSGPERRAASACRRRGILDDELHAFAAVPAVDLQAPGDVERQPRRLQQRRAERALQRAEGDRLDAARPGIAPRAVAEKAAHMRSEEHTSEIQSLMRISYAVFCLKKKK